MAPGYLGGGLPCLSSALRCQYPKLPNDIAYWPRHICNQHASIKVTWAGLKPIELCNKKRTSRVWINGTYVNFTLINDVEIITNVTCRQQPTTISSVYSLSLQDSNLGRQVTRFVVIYCVHSFSQQARDL